MLRLGRLKKQHSRSRGLFDDRVEEWTEGNLTARSVCNPETNVLVMD